RFLLEVSIGWHGCVVNFAREVEAIGEPGDERGVGIGLRAAQMMIDVKHSRGELEFVQEVQKADGVGSARHSDGDAPASGEHAVSVERASKFDTTYCKCVHARTTSSYIPPGSRTLRRGYSQLKIRYFPSSFR